MTKCLQALSALFAAGGLVLLPQAALAQDANDFAAKFAAAYEYSGYAVTFGEGTVADGTIIYDGATIGVDGLGDLFGPLTIPGPITVEGVVAEPDGGYTATRLAMPTFGLEMEGFSFSVADFVLEGLELPAGPEIAAAEALRLIKGASTGLITVEGGPPVTIAGTRADVTITDAPDGPVFDAVSSVTGIMVDFSGLEALELEAGLAILGKTALTGRIDQTARWSLGTGRMEIPETAITLDGIGKFNLSMDLFGYTASLMDELAASQKSLAAITDTDDRIAAELAIGQTTLSALSLGHIALRFEELGLIGALIGFSADAQGISREEAVDNLVLQLPVLLGSSGTVGDVARLAEAADAFLRDPRALEFKVAFDPPFAFSSLLTEEEMDEAPEGMSVTLSANGLEPVPLDLEALPIEDMLDMMMEGGADDSADDQEDAQPAERPGLPAPAPDPRG